MTRTLGASFGALPARNADQSGLDSRISRLTVPLNGCAILASRYFCHLNHRSPRQKCRPFIRHEFIEKSAVALPVRNDSGGRGGRTHTIYAAGCKPQTKVRLRLLVSRHRLRHRLVEEIKMTFRSSGRAKRNLRHWAHGQLGALTAPSCKQGLSVFLSIGVTLSSLNLDGCAKTKQAQQAATPTQQAPPTSYATPTADQLYSLVAPIALFPDNLLAQVLAGSTFPDQITTAYQWVQQNSTLKGQQFLEAVNRQPWDASVKG